MRLFFFDTETTGVVQKAAPISQQPYVVEFGALVYDIGKGQPMKLVETIHFLCKPPIPIPPESSKIHGIDEEKVRNASSIQSYLPEIVTHMTLADIIIGHNVSFDLNVLYFELKRANSHEGFTTLKDRSFCTMLSTIDLLKIPGNYGYKWPKLSELHKYLFGEDFKNAHSALSDIEATARCFTELMRRELIELPENLKRLFY